MLQLRNDKISQFNKKGINTIEDLVNFLPRKYYDFTQPEYIMYLENDSLCCTIGTIQNINLTDKVLQFDVVDDKGWHLYACFFHMDYLAKQFEIGDRVLVCGVIKQGRFKTMFNPTVFTKDIESNLKIHPVYSSIKGMSSAFLESKIKMALQLLNKEDFIEPELQKKYGLISNYQSLKYLHYPSSMDDVKQAKKRLLFNDLFLFNYHMKEMENKCSKETNIEIKTIEKTKKLIASLPYPLTEGNGVDTKGQKDVLNELTLQMMKGERLNALIESDVGTGKTLIAICLSCILQENCYQTVMVAPTNILAKQHYNEFSKLLEPMGCNVGFLSSDLKKSEQNKVLKDLKNGEIDILVGTHSVFNNNVQFKNLGLVVIDEEQKFGVNQRNRFNSLNTHKVSMSATPIPRSLALSLYGQITTEIINIKPQGRKHIETHVVLPSKKNEVYFHILEELEKKHQAYIICSLKEECEQMENMIDINEEYNMAKSYFGRHGYTVEKVSGGSTKKTDIARTAQILEDFKDGKIDVLIGTSILEVGVNNPNATIIAINNSERFGMSTLWQIKGRVGRGSAQSYCYLMTDNIKKLEIFEKADDGFKIAEEDLKQRGAGSFLGTQQSGENKYLMLIMGNKKLNEYIKKDIDVIFDDETRRKKYHDLIEIQEV